MRHRCIAFASFIAVATIAPAGAQTFITRTTNGNGRNIVEVRLGGSNTTTPGAPVNQGLLVGAITSGPTAGTTSLIAGIFDGRTVFDPAVPLPPFGTVVASGQVFSLGSGCQRGNVTVFPYINNLRPQLMRYVDGAFVTSAPAIANTDQYDSADCRTSTDGSTIFFMFSNRTDSTIEFFKETAAGFAALPPATTFPNAGTPYGGGIRPSFDVAPLGVADRLRLVYGYNSGPTQTTTMIGDVDPGAGTHVNFCPILVGVRPTAFTRPRETGQFFVGTFAGGVSVSVGDFDNDGIVDIFRTTPACTTTRTAAGSSNGGGAFNWTGYGGAIDARTGSLNVLWGDYFYVDAATSYTVGPASPGPFPGRGGPVAACSAYDVDSGTEIVSVATDTNQTQLELARGHRDPDKIFQSGMSRSEVMAFCIRGFFP